MKRKILKKVLDIFKTILYYVIVQKKEEGKKNNEV